MLLKMRIIPVSHLPFFYIPNQPKVEYSLTETGKELIPFIQYLVDWGYILR